MKIELISGATAYDAAINTIRLIDTNNLEMENLVVVPDSFSMQAENLLFDTLKINSTLNTEVVGISRLASKILRNNNIPFKRITALEEIFSIYRAVKMCEGEFQYFNKCSVDFCIKILQIIKQFKGCKITPERIKSVGDDYLDRKMHDLKIIYIAYENLLDEKLDLSKLLDFFIENAENSINLSKINLFFVNFDSFSVEINSFICKLAKFVNAVYIGMARAISRGNEYIYEDDIRKKTMQLAKENLITPIVRNFESNLTGHKLDMVKNLFSFDIAENKNKFFLNVLAKNSRDEVEYVAKYIKNKLVQGKRFKNFSVAVSDKKYYEHIKSIFSQYGICFYCDDASNLTQTILGEFLFKMMEIAKLGFDRQQFEFIASSPLIEKDEQALGEIFKYQIEELSEFLSRFGKYKGIVQSILDLQRCKTAANFAVVLKEIMTHASAGHQSILAELDERHHYKKQSENLQAEQLITKVLDKIAELGGDEQFSLSDYENLLNLAFKSVKVETIPTYIDAVYVGDATDSYFEDVDFLFVLGATANSLPRQQNDTGIIDDSDIQKLRLNFLLEPEIRVLNRRSRLKLFELLQHADEHLIVLTPMSENGKQSQRADFVEDLIKLFGNNVYHTSAMEMFDVGVFTPEEEVQRMLFYVGTRSNLMRSYGNIKDSLSKQLSCSLEATIKEKMPTVQLIETVKNAEKFDKVSASALESYFACPFKHFLQRGFKIKERESVEPNPRLFGTYQHELLRRFVSSGDVRHFTEKEIGKFLDENVLLIAKGVYDESVLKNATFLKFLRNESKIVLKSVIKEQKFSDFRPILLEEKILEPFGNGKLIGYVDRVDKCGDYFRIIDYKTGKTGNLKTELFYGKKLQLFLYAKAMKKRLGLECAGVYYFGCQTKYTKFNQQQRLLNGMTLKDNSVVLMTDCRLDEDIKSDLIGMRPKKKADEGEFAFRNGNPVGNFEELFEYAEKISLKAMEEIESGYIACKPFKDECKDCPYISICKHTDGMRKTLKEKKETDGT